MNFALVPVKALAFGKSRLSSCLTPEARQAVSRAMLTDVLTSALHASAVDRVVVVSSDASLLFLARQLGALTVDEEYPRGLNGAVTVGTDFCLQHGATAVLVLLADLPLVTADDIDLLFHSVSKAENVVLVPCKEGDGTNAFLRVPPLVIPSRFGGPSLDGHQRVAQHLGIACQVVKASRIAFDVDSVDDLKWLATQATATRTSQVLRELGVATEVESKT
ncbi:MAG: 2-phospho-L-lactate guanylyltransferase [Deltaproteobacteria bacterium]|nr:2-phospho-L-lactate guanylyltransferase [Deltaproteobacteria bacterium]